MYVTTSTVVRVSVPTPPLPPRPHRRSPPLLPPPYSPIHTYIDSEYLEENLYHLGCPHCTIEIRALGTGVIVERVVRRFEERDYLELALPRRVLIQLVERICARQFCSIGLGILDRASPAACEVHYH